MPCLSSKSPNRGPIRLPLGNTIGVEWAWVIPALSASAFFLTVIVGRPLGRYAAYIPVLAILLGFVLFWYVLRDLLNNGPASFSVNWLVLGDTQITWGTIVDRLSVVMLGLVTFVSLLVQVYSLEYLKGEPRFSWYFAVHGLFAAAMLSLVLADNLLFLYVAWELVGLGSYLLIGFWWEKRSAAEAAKKAFVTTRLGDVGLLIGIILLFRTTGTFDIATIFHVAQTGGISEGTLNAAMFLIFLGAMGKSAQFPFHVWLPDAMEGPTPVSALIHAATMVAAGVFLVARLFPLFELTPDVLTFVAVVGLFTFAFAGTLALVMTDLKRVLAYSTVSHLGLMMLALGAGAVGAAIFHLVAHGVSKALLFLGAGSLTHATHKTEIWEMGGLLRRLPITSITFLIGAATLAGIPPLSGFFTKDEVLAAVNDDRGLVFLALALVGSLLSALYMARVSLVVLFGRLKPDNERAAESPFLITAPLVILAPLAVTLGFLAFNWPDSFHGFASFIVEDQPLVAGAEAFHVEPLVIALSTAAVLGGVVVGWVVYAGEVPRHRAVAERYRVIHRILVRKYYVDEGYQWAIDRIVLAFSGFVALFDRIVVNDTGVDGSAFSVMLSAMRLRRVQSGRMYNYGLAMAIGVFSLAVIWWAVLT